MAQVGFELSPSRYGHTLLLSFPIQLAKNLELRGNVEAPGHRNRCSLSCVGLPLPLGSLSRVQHRWSPAGLGKGAGFRQPLTALLFPHFTGVWENGANVPCPSDLGNAYQLGFPEGESRMPRCVRASL